MREKCRLECQRRLHRCEEASKTVLALSEDVNRPQKMRQSGNMRVYGIVEPFADSWLHCSIGVTGHYV